MRRKLAELLVSRRGLHVTENLTRTAIPKLSPYDVRNIIKKIDWLFDKMIKRYCFSFLKVTSIIRKKEFAIEFPEGPVKSYETNQLSSNSPVEDSRSECSLVHTTGKL